MRVNLAPSIHYSSRNSPVKHQTWSITQDNRGLIYIADEDGINIFDGQNWVKVETVTGTTVRSLDVSHSGIVYYGAQGEIGFINVSVDGSYSTNAIELSGVNQKSQFGDVWYTHTVGDSVVFQSREAVFIYDGSVVERWTSETAFHTSFVVENEVYVREEGVGLLRFDGRGFELVPGGEKFAHLRIYMMESLPGGGILLGTQEGGLARYVNDEFSFVSTYLDKYQNDHRVDSSPLRLYFGTKVGQFKYAIGSLGAGVILIDSWGNVLQTIDHQDGLPDDWINSIFIDENGGYWLALDNEGVTYINTSEPLTRYGREDGIRGPIRDIYGSGDQLFVAAGSELLSNLIHSVKINSKYNRNVFEPEFDVSLPWSIARLSSGLAIATDIGLRVIFPQEKKTAVKCNEDPTFILFVDGKNELILAGTKYGLYHVFIRQGTCTFEKISGISAEIRSITADTSQGLWLGTRHSGLINLPNYPSFEPPLRVVNYTTADGLPSQKIDVKEILGRPIFYSEEGAFRYDPVQNRFYEDQQMLRDDEADSDSLFALGTSSNGDIWIAYSSHIQKVSFSDTQTPHFQSPEILKFRKTSTSTIQVDDEGIVWFNDGDELIRYDPKLDKKREAVFHALVSRVKENSSNETIFSGSFANDAGGFTIEQPKSAIPVQDYDQKNLTIEVSAPSFTYPDKIRYQTRVDGRDKDWSGWTNQTEYSFSNLREGAYTFHVRARDASGRISDEASYSFVILPPWYRTWWAYLAYVALFSLVTYSVRKYVIMVRAHKLAAQQAEDLAREREYNRKLQEANERLTRANKLKDEFLATTSHELRTPLTAILGFTSVLKEEIPQDADYREFLDIIEESGGRLMDTLNSLLDLAKLRSGMMDIHLESVDAYAQCQDAISALIPSAERKGLKLVVERPPSPLFVPVDVQALSTVIQNLVGNAIKFTEEGSITLSVVRNQSDIQIRIKDTGIGIDADFLPQLFEEFMQESDGPSRTYEGTGLGLAITARIVKLMEGNISVESEKGNGSVFSVTFTAADPPVGQPVFVGGIGSASLSSNAAD